MWSATSAASSRRFPTPEEATAYPHTAQDLATVQSNRAKHFIGDPASVKAQIRELVAATGADEIMVTTMIHDPSARLRSYELLAHAFDATKAA